MRNLHGALPGLVAVALFAAGCQPAVRGDQDCEKTLHLTRGCYEQGKVLEGPCAGLADELQQDMRGRGRRLTDHYIRFTHHCERICTMAKRGTPVGSVLETVKGEGCRI